MENNTSFNDSKNPRFYNYVIVAITIFFIFAIPLFFFWLSGSIPYIKFGNVTIQRGDGYYLTSDGLIRAVSIAGFVREINGNKVVVEEKGKYIEFETYEGTQFSFEQEGQGGLMTQIRNFEEGDIGIGNAIQAGLVFRDSRLVADTIIQVQADSGSAPYDN